MKFIMKMFSDSGEISIKRVIAFIYVILIAQMVIRTRAIDMTVLLTLASNVLILCGINAAIDLAKIKANKEVAIDVAKVPDPETAKQIIDNGTDN